MTPTVTVVISTWRIGGLDCTLPALASQTFADFEVVIADDIYRWRSDPLLGRLFPFPVLHVSTDHNLYPLTQAPRGRNTGVRHANGRLIAFLADYAVPPSSWLETHVRAHDAGAGVVVSPYRLWSVDPKVWVIPVRSDGDLNAVWDQLDMIRGRPGLGYSTFDPAATAAGILRDHVRTHPQPQPSPTIDKPPVAAGPDHCHWKCDSVSVDLYRSVNGSDEEYAGFHGFDDWDVAERLRRAGATFAVTGVEVPILDAHPVLPRPLQDYTRDNFPLWQATRHGERPVRCRHGLFTMG